MDAPESSFRRPFWEGWGIALALLSILSLTLGGGLYLRAKLHEIEAEIPQIEATKLREGFIVLGDLQRLEQALDKAVGSMATTAAAERDAVVAALDYLFVRADSFRTLHEKNVADDSPAMMEVIDTIVAEGDAALAAGPPALSRFARRLEGLLEEARADLLAYVDMQHQSQNAAIAAQQRILERMTLSAAALLTMFGLLSSGMVFLLRAEFRTNRKRMAAESRARFLAYFDPLTGLLNRTSFAERGAALLGESTDPVLALLDIDNFKTTNDSHGHAAGDAVLQAVAAAISQVARGAGGIAARLGGDEFALLLPGSPSPGGTDDLAQRILREAGGPVQFERLVLNPRCSLGICRAWHLAGTDPPLLSRMLKSADLALYEAKAAGRGTFRHYDADLAAEIAGRRALEEELPRALEAGEFRLAFQPQVELSDRRLHGVEALVRWQRGKEHVPPGRFIPTAEETGLICEIDLWVLRNAARRVAGWLGPGAPELRLSVNLSSLHFRTEAIVEHVQDVLLETGLPPRLLTLEITETVLLENRAKAMRVVERLHRLGVQIALDDFGTGYSGLGYLQEMHVDVIKIDRSFVGRLASSEETRFILQAVVSMAKGLGMTVVAEGIETETQAALVASFGCDIGQGYHFARPLAPEAMQAALLDGARSRPA